MSDGGNSLRVFRHQVSDCPCGHGEHIGRGFEAMTSVICPVCEDVERHQHVTVTVVPVESAETMGLSFGSQVRYEDRAMTVEGIEQVTKLWGRIKTPFVRVLMAPAKE